MALPIHLTPDTALLTGTVGILLIYFELNRPGRILPGAGGLLLLLIASANLQVTPLALLLIALAATVFLLSLRLGVRAVAFACATLTLTLGFSQISHVHVPFAVTCGIILGTATAVLTRIARRARLNKGLD